METIAAAVATVANRPVLRTPRHSTSTSAESCRRESQTNQPPGRKRQPPPRYSQLDDTQCDPNIIDRIRSAGRAGHWPIYIHGEVGVGKSFLAAWAYCHWPGTSVQMLNYCDFANTAIQAAKGEEVSYMASNGSKVLMSGAGWWNWLDRVGLLIIDEIGSGYVGEWRSEDFWKLLELRAGRPLIMTGNDTIGTISQRFDLKVASRIMAGTIIGITGQDRRRDGIENRVFRY